MPKTTEEQWARAIPREIDITGKLVRLDPKIFDHPSLPEEEQRLGPLFQVDKNGSGFGAQGQADRDGGTAVYGHFQSDGERARVERFEVVEVVEPTETTDKRPVDYVIETADKLSTQTNGIAVPCLSNRPGYYSCMREGNLSEYCSSCLAHYHAAQIPHLLRQTRNALLEMALEKET